MRPLAEYRALAARFVDDVLETIAAALASGEDVRLHEFGVFTVRRKAERVGPQSKNGRAGAHLGAARGVRFGPSRGLVAAVQGAGKQETETEGGGNE